MNRFEQRKAATHQNLLRAAREVIVAQGYENVDILTITERADVSKATFYQHFENKEACVRELILHGFQALEAEIFSSEKVATSPRAWVQESLTKLFQWAEDNRAFVLIMVGGHASSELNAFGRGHMVEVSQRILSEGIPGLSLRYSAEITAQLVTGTTIHMLGWWLESGSPLSADEMAAMLSDILWRSLIVPGDDVPPHAS